MYGMSGGKATVQGEGKGLYGVVSLGKMADNTGDKNLSITELDFSQ